MDTTNKQLTGYSSNECNKDQVISMQTDQSLCSLCQPRSSPDNWMPSILQHQKLCNMLDKVIAADLAVSCPDICSGVYIQPAVMSHAQSLPANKHIASDSVCNAHLGSDLDTSSDSDSSALHSPHTSSPDKEILLTLTPSSKDNAKPISTMPSTFSLRGANTTASTFVVRCDVMEYI